jgi:hypothetical protein
MFATIAGAYPPPELPGQDGLRQVLADQVGCGLGMVSDGSIQRVSSEGDLEPVIDRWRTADSIVRELAEADGLEPPLVKACVVGPVTLGGGVGLLRELLVELFRSGAPVVQIDEPILVGITDMDALRRAQEGWLELLRGVEGHVSLAILGGTVDAAAAESLFGAPFASYLLDLVVGPDNWRLAARAPGDRGLIVGVADARTDRPDTEAVMVWGARYAASMRGRGPERVGLAPSVGLERLSPEAARAKLIALAEAARKAGLPAEQLAREIDPRAVDARSAALGRYQPRPQRRHPPS